MNLLCIFSLFNFLLQIQGALQPKDLIFIILSQSNTYDAQIATNLKQNICDQATSLQLDCPVVHLLHEEFRYNGDWTILPILPELNMNSSLPPWIIFIEDRTVIRLDLLLETLNKYDTEKNIYIGYSLEDKAPTIIHHFHEERLKYPHLGAGIAITKSLLQNVSGSISEDEQTDKFIIDKSFELALFFENNSNGTFLHDDAFCVKEADNCASYPQPFSCQGEKISSDSVYFAVKTCEKFHKDRVPVVLDTWAKYAERFGFFSDVIDETIPTISVGVPNTESGHCEKSLRILEFLNEKMRDDSSIKWVVLVDDDTILSVSRILEVLSCYDPNEDIAIGERYRYDHVFINKRHDGFNYLTGGAGIAFSKSAIEKLVNYCACPSISSPDDMAIGRCLFAFGSKQTHSYLFHQARPMDYNTDFLSSDKHVSFHKHWMMDPIAIYKEWFEKDDSKLVKNINSRTEL